MRTGRILKRISFIALVLLAAVSAYYGIVVIKARSKTPALIREKLNDKRVKLRLKDLSQWQIKALLAVEDPGFYEHKGVDLETPGAGITTITQNLVKIFYFTHFQPGIAKLKQTLIARFALDPLTAKDDQLVLLINYVYMGSLQGKAIYGFSEAAEAYYRKPFYKLNADEYLSLVAMIIAPTNFNPVTCSPANAERTNRIKKVISGEYKPKSLMDIYYGKLDAETRKGLAPASYFPSIYNK